MKPYDDPIALEVSSRSGVILDPPPPGERFTTDASASPRETLNLALYGQIMAERERLRRSAE